MLNYKDLYLFTCGSDGAVYIWNIDKKRKIFEIKEKWTGKELKLFMNDLEIPNLHEKVGRVTQTVTEQNIFDKSKQLTYFYYKKNPFFKK